MLGLEEMELGQRRFARVRRGKTRPRRNDARFRQGRKRNVRRKEDQPTSHKKKKWKDHTWKRKRSNS